MTALTWAGVETPWDDWDYIYAIIEIDGRLVAGGRRNSDLKAIAYSDDGGDTWTSVTTPFDSLFDSVYCFAYSPDRTTLVAGGFTNGGATTLAYSLDQGETWNDAGNPGTMNFIASVWRDDDDDLFVAAGVGVGDECIATSADGQTWTPRSTPWDGGAFANGVCRARGAIDLWIAVGVEPGFTPTKTGMQSADGLTWTVMAPGPFDGQSSGYTAYGFGQAVTYDAGSDRVIAGAYSGTNALAWMDDSLAWTNAPSDLDGDVLYALAAAAAGRIAAAGALGLAESTDGGETWTFDATSPWVSGDPAPSSIGALGVFLLADGVTGYATGTDGTFAVALASGSAETPAGPIYARFFTGFETRIVITRIDPTPDAESVVETVTLLERRTLERSFTRLLNRPHEVRAAMASDDQLVSRPHDDGHPYVEEGVRALLWFRREVGATTWVIRDAFIIDQCEDTADTDQATTRITGHDGWGYLDHRAFRNDDGDIAGPDGFSYTAEAGHIALKGLLNTITHKGSVYIDFGEDWGGTSFWAGTVEETAEIDYNVQQGAMVGEVWTDLADAAYFDIVLTAIYDPDNRPGYLWEGSLLAEAGTDKHDVIFGWDAPPRTLSGITRLKDGAKRANLVQFVDADGNPVDPEESAPSIAVYGVWEAVQNWPGQTIDVALTALAQEQLRLRKNGQTTVTIQPVTERAPRVLTAYDKGDRVHLNASTRLRRPLSGLTRIYGIQLEPGADGTERVTQLLTSADGL